MLTRQVKVRLDRDVDDAIARLSHRDCGAKGACIRRIVLAAARSWERDGATPQFDDIDAAPIAATRGTAVSVKVWFTEHDLHFVARLAACECLTVAQCIRRTVTMYVKRLTSARR